MQIKVVVVVVVVVVLYLSIVRQERYCILVLCGTKGTVS